MFISIFLTAPTAIFTNALPSSGLISGRTTPIIARAVFWELPRCSGTNGLSGQGIDLTPDICSDLPLELLNAESGTGVNIMIDTTVLDCIIYYFGKLQCGGYSIGKTDPIGPSKTLGRCIDFIDVLAQLPNLSVGAKSAKMTCKNKSGWRLPTVNPHIANWGRHTANFHSRVENWWTWLWVTRAENSLMTWQVCDKGCFFLGWCYSVESMIPWLEWGISDENQVLASLFYILML